MSSSQAKSRLSEPDLPLPPQVVRAKERLDEELRIQAQEDREKGQKPKT